MSGRDAPGLRSAVLRTTLSLACLAWLLFATSGAVLADSPSPSPGSDSGGDTRTTGQGPGLEGSPLYAIGGVLLIACVSIGLSQVYLRATPKPSPAGDPPVDDPGPG